MEAREFSGFTVEAFDFLEGLSANNNREWFEAQKSTYKTPIAPEIVRSPELVDEALARFRHMAPVEEWLVRSVFPASS
jgi:uncharacterized protein (DUF2461 family)